MIDMQPFCCTDVTERYAATLKPFIIRPWRYATDARICVRVMSNVGEATTTGKLPPADRLGWDHYSFPADKWKPWPAATTEKGPWTCAWCYGDGRVDKCAECDRSDKCERCDGTGFVPYPPRVTLGKLDIAGFYDAKIRKLPDVRYYVDAPGQRVLFVFDGGEGILMALADN